MGWTLWKSREFNLETHLWILKKFGRVIKGKLREIMYWRGFPNHLIKIIKLLYRDTTIIIYVGCSKCTKDSHWCRGLYSQEYNISSIIFLMYIIYKL